MKGSRSVRCEANTTDHRKEPRQIFSPPSPGRASLARALRTLTVLGLVMILVAPALSSLPTSVQQLSPVGSSHASISQGPAGEGPSGESRSVEGRASFLNIEPTESILGMDSDGIINATFIVEERNNMAATLTSYSYRVLYLDDTVLIPYSGGNAIDVTVDALGEAEVSFLGNVPGYITFELMEKGIDKLKMDITFRGTNCNADMISVVVRAPLHILQRVAMVVDEDVYPLIKDKLARYEEDINMKTKAEFFYEVDSWTTPEQVRNALKRLWTDEGITGAILWGYLPVPMWSMVHSDNSTEDFPIPIFYEDLDGSFEDIEGDGLYDRHYWGDHDGAEIWVSHVMPPRPLVPSTNLDPRGAGTGGGLVGNYYNSRTMNFLEFGRVDPEIDFYWQADLPEKITDDDFAIKWTGRIKADVTEQYTLSPQHGGTARIWIDGSRVHEKNSQTWNVIEYLTEVYLNKGWHDIKIEYTNGNWGFTGAARLMWTSDTLLAATINEWLDKTHAYHNGVMDYNKEALLFMDYGYGTKCRMAQPIHNRQIEPLYGDDVVVKGLVNTTSADDYIEALEDGYELVSVWSHAGSASHQINAPGVPPEANTSAPSWKIRETEANVVTLIWGCHAGDYGNKGPGTTLLSDNLAANYAFATPNGLACAAATRSIGTTFKNVYWAWANGSCLGTGFLANLEEEYDRLTIERTVPNLATDKWVKDMVLMGDPFLTIDHRPWGQSIAINDGAEFTTDGQVTLHVSAKDANEMRFKNSGGTWTPWESFASTKEWVIGDGYGTRRVYFQTRNDWGQARFAATDVITVVSTMLDQVSIEINDGASSTCSKRLSLSIDIGEGDGTKVMMGLRDDGSEWSEWMAFCSELTWSLSDGDGDRSVHLRFIEEAGLFTAEAEDGILLDTTPPKSVATVTGEVGICSWYVSPLTIEMEATDALSEVDRIEWNLDDGEWETYSAPVFIDEDGIHEFNFRSFDTLGNSETGDRISFMIDTAGPEDLQLGLVDANTYVNLPTVNLAMAATDIVSGLDSMRFRINDGDWGNWMTYQDNFFLTLPNVEGQHSISLSVKDVAGNEAVTPEDLLVVLDRTPPTVVVTDPTDEQEWVSVDQAITVEVSEDIDVSTLTAANILVQDGKGVPVAGEFEFDVEDRTIKFTPDEEFEYYTSYSVMMRAEITDLASNQLNDGAGQMWSFFTEGILPDGPGGVAAEPKDEAVMVSWESVSGTYSGELQGYNVYRMVDDGSYGRDFEFRGTTSDTTFTDDDVEMGILYHYKITAITTCGEGDLSGVGSAIIVPPVDEPEEPVEDPEDKIDPTPKDNVNDLDDGSPVLSSSVLGVIGIAIVIAVVIVAVMVVGRQNGQDRM